MSEGNEDWILLARLVRPQGRRGEILAEVFTDFPLSFSDRKRVFLRSPTSATSPTGAANQAPRETRVEAQWLHKERVVLKFVHVDSITEADALRGWEVVVPREERMPLAEDAVYVSDLLGAWVVDVRPDGAGMVGRIVDVEPEGTGPALLVLQTAAGEERLIPFVRAFLRKVDLQAGRVEMELPEGLLAMQAPSAIAGPEDGEDTGE